MKYISPGIACSLLIGAALLLGTAAMWTVADEPEQPQTTDEQAVEETKTTAEQPAATEAAEPAETTEATEATSTSEAAGAEATIATGTDDELKNVLRILGTGSAVPAELRDPAFDYYVDLTLLGTAWVDLDPALITDLALQFLEGERVLRRPHRVIKCADIMKIAVRLAIVKNDEESLARLEKAIEERGDEQLTAALAEAKAEFMENEGESAWMVSVATTSALEFARYKGVLQDIEAAIIAQDRDTLQQLAAELDTIKGLPEKQRVRLQEKVQKALAKLPEEGQAVSQAATILDKLAHASRRFPAAAQPVSGQTIFPSIATQCPATITECQMVSTTCPEGGAETQCPAVMTQCPQYTTYCPAEECNQPTQQPDTPTECQEVPTQCPAYDTYCPQDQCQQPTQFPSAATQCQTAPTQCQSMETTCPGDDQCQQPTQFPDAATQCQAVPTQCAAFETSCPGDDQCQQPTQFPNVPTQCQSVPTQCPPFETYCPECGEQPTQYPSVATQCQAVATQCRSAPTQCSSTQTKNCRKPTMTPQVPTQCSSTQTKNCQKPTMTPQVPTQCSSTQSKNCGKPSLFPEVPTRCPSVMTRCPRSPTYCPPDDCGQQQQKQKWIPPKKGRYPGGGYQESSEQGTIPATPYRRRDDYDLGR